MNTIHKIVSSKPNKVSGILYNGRIVKAGSNKNFKTALFFNNESTYIDEPKSYVDVVCDTFKSNQLSLSMWIHPKKTSIKNSPIFKNTDKDQVTGVFYNCSDENEGELGVMWNEDKQSTPTKIGILIPNEGWIHLVFIFQNFGKVKVFGNGVYLKNIDLGRELEKINFSEIKLGGFCGWLDNFNLYINPLKYGGVNIGQTASQNISYLFNINRVTGDLITPIDLNSEDETEPFYYIQNEEYVNAYENYKLQKKFNHSYYEEESLYNVGKEDGTNKKIVADGSFRTLLGKIVDKQPDEK